jgi:hypothetical protein
MDKQGGEYLLQAKYYNGIMVMAGILIVLSILIEGIRRLIG